MSMQRTGVTLLGAVLLVAGCVDGDAPRTVAAVPVARPAQHAPIAAPKADEPAKPVPELATTMIKDPDPMQRRESVYSIADAEGTDQAAVIGQALTDPDPRVRTAAIEAMTGIEDGAAADWLSIGSAIPTRACVARPWRPWARLAVLPRATCWSRHSGMPMPAYERRQSRCSRSLRSPPKRSGNRLPQTNSIIGQLRGIRAGALADQLARGHEILGMVHGVERDQLAVAQVAEAEGARRGIAAQDHPVIVLREPDDLQLQLVLVRPEPRRLVMRNGFPAEVRGCGLRLLEGVVHRLEADAPAVALARVAAAVADGVNVRVARAAVLVHRDAVVALESRGLGERAVRHEADADDHEVRWHLRAVRALDGVDAAVAEEALHLALRQHVDAVACVLGLVEAAHLRRDHAVHHAVHHFDDGDVEPELAECRCALEADVAGAHDRDAHAGLDAGADRLDVRHRAQHVHAGQVRAAALQRACVAADREHKLVVGEAAAVRELHLARGGVDADDRVAEHELAVDAIVECAVPDRQALNVHLAADELLRQRRALVGQGGFAADHHEAARVAVAAQAVYDLRGGMPASGDDDGVLHAKYSR